MSNITNPTGRSKPDQCHLWSSPLTWEMLQDTLGNLKWYKKDYHYARQLKRCNSCGQLYFHEFYEEVDFRDGEDRQYFIFIPVDNIKAADELNQLTRLELTSLPGIYKYSPPYDAEPYWRNKEDF